MITTILSPKEMTKLATLWEFHRGGIRSCTHQGDMKIEMLAGCIGTTVKATCACGVEMDVTDYLSW